MNPNDIAVSAGTPITTETKSKLDKNSGREDFSRIYGSFKNQQDQNKKKIAPQELQQHDGKSETLDASCCAGNANDDLLGLTKDSHNSPFLALQNEEIGIQEAKLNDSSLLTNLLSPASETTNPPIYEQNFSDKSSSTWRRYTPLPERDSKIENNDNISTQANKLSVISTETHFAPVRVSSGQMNFSPEMVSSYEGNHASVNIADADLSEKFMSNRVASDMKRPADDQQDAIRSTAPQSSFSQTSNSFKPAAAHSSPSFSSDISSKSSDIAMPITEKGAIDSNYGTFARSIDQIITHVRELTASVQPSAKTPVSSPLLNTEINTGPVRILRLQLQPEELGLVTARLRIVGGVLEVRLTADHQQSVEVLRRDQENLIETLQRTGYKVEIASIDYARPQHASQQPASQASAQSGNQGMGDETGSGPSSNRNDNTNQHQERSDREEKRPQLERRNESGEANIASDHSAVYL